MRFSKQFFLFILSVLFLLILLSAARARADEPEKAKVVAEPVQKQNTSVLSFVTKAMRQLDPKNEHTVMAQAVADVVDGEEPIFKGDVTKLRTAALVVAVAFREGSLKPSVEGDCSGSKPGEKCVGKPSSFCALQINVSMGGGPWLNENPLLCIQRGLSIMRKSSTVCPSEILAWYVSGGVNACTNERSIRISRDRVNLARRLFSKRDAT